MILAHELSQIPAGSIERESISTLIAFYCKHYQPKTGNPSERRQPKSDKRK